MLSGAIICFIFSIMNGDTVFANCNGQQILVRLAEIDAPEKRQDVGLRSKQSLSEMCLHKNAEVIPRATNKFGGTIAYLNCSGIYAHREQIKRGMAWVYDGYATDESLYALQDKARSSHIGIWENPTPVPPWEWRKVKR